MRIIAGEWRGRRLSPVGKGDRDAHLRPTSDRVRESLFSMLSHRLDFEGMRILDLFAGTGALGLEALSRGGDEAVFVENGRKSQKLLAENIRLLGADGRAKIMHNDVTRLGSWPNAPFDLVLLDPPYGKDLGQKALRAILEGGWLAPDAMIVWEEASEMPVPEGLMLEDRRRYGGTYITVLSAPS
ncbi:MAG: 16S rRNA (guanine(966)-N(2))-methyltransferase RsmD [Pseudomonadota bacterium]